MCGESAGAISVAALMTSPHAAGLFHRAILQSGPPHTMSRREGAKTVRSMAKRLRIPATAEAFAAVDRDLLLDAQAAVVDRSDPIGGGPGFHIVVDGDVVPAAPPLPEVDLLGCNREEYRLWFVPGGTVDRITRITLRLALLKIRVPQRVARLYRATRPHAKPGEILGEMATDLLPRGPLNRLADSRPARTFVYEFCWRSPVIGTRRVPCAGTRLRLRQPARGRGPDQARRAPATGRRHAPGLGRLRHYRTAGLVRLERGPARHGLRPPRRRPGPRTPARGTRRLALADDRPSARRRRPWFIRLPLLLRTPAIR
ncbi:hypothetical protein GCM10015535_59400 [Streptomyces gelaticus]|uniref:Carboxylesterase type B domain-containing protein n=1 Tax=Streptomyces gelaticus TaxID=285446 RepID=A0ABQ2W7A5_9ACTN|nr:hypothetical protein GCM10015535_59400 [Streptomyces gelaticus]